MLIDVRSIGHGASLETDLCIVGAGPAGITLARECASAGFRICLLESGSRRPDRASRRLVRGENAGRPYFPIADARVRAFGGSANHWLADVGLRARPLDPIDFTARPEIPGYTGWPFDRDALLPYYRRAHPICGLGPWDYAVDGSSAALLDHDGELEPVLFRFGAREIFPGAFDEIASSRTVSLALDATAIEVVPAAGRPAIAHVRVGSPTGGEFRVVARRFVLASGGIENARLLLLSGRQGEGVGNRHGLVGRFFMEHLGLRCGVWYPAGPETFSGLGLYQRHDGGDGPVMRMLGLREEVLRRERLLNAALFLIAVPRFLLSPGARSLGSIRLGLGLRPRAWPTRGDLFDLLGHPLSALELGLRKLSHRSSGHEDQAVRLVAMAEQAPNPDSRIVLGRRRDAFGLPVARLDWRPTEFDLESIRRTREIIDDALRRHGLGRLEPPPERRRGILTGQWHHMGTTRMHADPARGVVDADGRVHELDNLYIVGSSVFPTGGYANPTLTIVALAVRLADHLKKQFEGGGDA